MPEYLRHRSKHVDSPTPPPHQPTARSPRSPVRTVALVLASAALASSVTFAITHRSDRSTPSSSASSSTTATTATTSTTSTVEGPNPVARVDQPAAFDGWVLVVKRYQVLRSFNDFPASHDRRWLVIDMHLTNSTTAKRDFFPEMIEARTLNVTGVATYTSAMPRAAWELPPHTTGSGQFVFSVSALAQTFTLVIRREILSGKRRGDAVEIDLNCC